MRFNTHLPVRFRVVAQKSAQMYELAIESKNSRNRTFSLRSHTRLEVGASYMAAAGDGTFSQLVRKDFFSTMDVNITRLLKLCAQKDYAQQLIYALLNASTREEYALIKDMLIQLLRGEIKLAAMCENLPILIEISEAKITIEHYILGRCELDEMGFSAEFTCVQDLLNKFIQ